MIAIQPPIPFIDSGGKQQIRRLCGADADAMFELERVCFSLPWTLAQCKTALANRNFCAYGIWLANMLAAYMSVYHVADELEILNIGVIPAKRRQGFGSRLLRTVLQAAHKIGMQKAVLEVRQGNGAAIALYKKFGFFQSGARPRYYTDNGETALIFSRSFNSKV